MAKPTEFQSPYEAPTCAYRLQQLAAHTTYRVTQRGRTTDLSRLRLDLVRDAEGGYAFALRMRGRDRSRRNVLGGIVYLTVGGRLVPTEVGAEVDVRVRPGLPVTIGEWLLQLLWYGALMTVGASLLGLAWVTGDPRFWQGAGGFALLVAALYLLLGLVHGRAVRATIALLARAVAAPAPDDLVRTAGARITVLR
ncbi:MAG: hypothetical protein JXC32_00720 [Anaerolineae bacterium]|nr:hypothetical protein [Anaerolineae bacterium]